MKKEERFSLNVILAIIGFLGAVFGVTDLLFLMILFAIMVNK